MNKKLFEWFLAVTLVVAYVQVGLTKDKGGRVKETKVKEELPKTVIYKLYIDKSVGSFWLLVPSDWKIGGGAVQQVFQPWRFNLSVEHPEGWGSFRFIPTPYYFTPNMFYGIGAMDNRGNIYLPYMEPAQYLRQVVVPGVYGSSNPKILEAKDLPSVAESYKNFCHLTEAQAMGINMDIKAGELRLEIVHNGVTYLDRLVVIDPRQHPLLNHVVQGLKGQIGVDGGDAVAKQHGKVMHFARLARLQHQRNPGAGGGADQVVMQTGNGQQRRDGGILLIHATVGKDQDGGACFNMADCCTEQAFQRLFHPHGAILCLEQQGQGDGLEAGLVKVAQLFKLFIGQYRLLQPDYPGAGGGGFQQVGFRADPDSR